MIKTLLAFLIILFTAIAALPQNAFTINGVIRDKKESLPGAGVYLSGYKISTVADNEGRFKISNLKPGSYDILVQMIGYLPYSKSVVISDKSIEVDLILKENTVQLNEVVIRADPNRAKYIKQFKEYFIGTTPNAALCKILNPQVLNIDYDVTKSLLTIKTDDFLVIENKALGYRLKYMLDYFEYNSRTNIIYFSGHPFFEELKAAGGKNKKYILKREIAYRGSAQHFLKSLYQGTNNEEGFRINKMLTIPNPYRYPDSIIHKNLVRLKDLTKTTVIAKNPARIDTAMVSFWLKQQGMPKYIKQLSKETVSTDTMVYTYNKNLKLIDYTGSLVVSYTKERESLQYSKTNFWIFRPLDFPNYEISIVNLLHSPVRFYENGGIYDSRSILYEGFWAYEKIADMVPMDYVPLAIKIYNSK